MVDRANAELLVGDELVAFIEKQNTKLLFVGEGHLRAAIVGYEVAAPNPALGDAERKTYATRGNAAEEKLVRASDAMMFAMKDLDGSESRGKPAELQKALAPGDEDKAQGLAMEAVDLKLFYPKPFKQVLLQPDAKA